MITGKEYLKKHIGETNIPEEYYVNEIGEMMDWYATDYHEEQVKNLSIAIVSKSVAKQYAEFCVRCDREGLPLLELNDYIKQYCC